MARVGDSEVADDGLVDREGVRTGVEVPNLGRPVTAHDAEGAVRDRCPGVDERKVGWRDIEQHHRRGAEVDLALGVERRVDGAGAALEG